MINLDMDAIRARVNQTILQSESMRQEEERIKVQRFRRVRLRDASEDFLERAALHEIEGGMSRAKAEDLAEREFWRKYIVLER